MAVSPAYTIHQYRDDMFKVVAFKGNRDPDVMYVRDREEQQHNDAKLDSNFSRARSMVLQYALCNPWQYFFTGTLDPGKWDRGSLDSFMVSFSQKIRDWRKVYGTTLSVLLVPEHHKDGAWHVHGLINNLPDYEVGRFIRLDLSSVGLGWLFPVRLCDGDYFNWYDFCLEFGYCSLAPIRDPVATAFYITKYVSKDLSRRSGDLGKHLYFHSRPLRKAEKASDVYLYNQQLDAYCTEDHDFCKTGIVEGAPWYFPYVWDGVEAEEQPFEAKPVAVQPREFRPQDIDPYYEQLSVFN